jgi:putative FmdB family regulatory protein
MPTYEYSCTNCGHPLEAFQSMKDAPLSACPACGRSALRRLSGRGTGRLFSGSGFFQGALRVVGDPAPTQAQGLLAPPDS